jgi:4-amino-4-deoxy-L-arabinose transferase-like glycosyltransferase
MRKNVGASEEGEDARLEAARLGMMLEWAGLSVVVMVFVWLMWVSFVPAFFGAVDESAYFLEAKVLARTGQPVFFSPGRLAFTSENMIERAPGEFVAKYPPGYPLLCAAGFWIAGVKGAMAVNLVMGVAAVLGVFMLLRGFVSGMLALAGTVTFAIHPMTVLYATGALSHMAETVFCVWGIVAVLRWAKKGGAMWVGLGCFLLAYACAIRYTAALVVLPFLVLAVPRALVLWRSRQWGKFLREFAAMAAGATGGLAPLLWYQWKAFGSPLATGYGLTQESVAFSWRWLTEHAWYALETLSRPGYGLVLFPLALAWLVFGAVKDRGRGAFLAAWIVPPVVLYMAYYWFPAPEHKANYVRFFFQLYPPVIVAAMLLVERLARGRFALQIAAAVAVGLIAVASFLFGGARGGLDRTVTLFPEAAAVTVNRNVPKGRPVLCDMHLSYFLVVATDAEIYSADYFDEEYVQRFAGSMGPGGNQVTDSLRARRFAEALGGRTQEQLDDLLREFLLERARRGMYLVTIPGRVEAWRERLGEKLELVVIERSAYEPVLLRMRARAGQTAHK